MSPRNVRFRVDLDTLITPHDMVWKDRLPPDWYEGAPLGNGDIGVMVSGVPEALEFVLSKTDVWDRRNDDRSYFPGRDYNTFRQTYFDNNWEEYLRLEAEASLKRREKTLGLPHLTSCGRVLLRLDAGLKASRCEMRVNLKDGVMRLQYIDRTVTALTSRQYNVLLVDIDRGAPEVDPPDPVTMNRYGVHPPLEELPWELWRPPLEGNPGAVAHREGECHFITQKFEAGGQYTVGVTFTAFAGSRAHQLPGRLAGTLSGSQNRHCQMYVAVVSSEDAADTVAECRTRLQRAVDAGAATILARHLQWWHDYWMRGLASVGDRGVEKWYYVSLYLCGCLFRPGRQSPGLQGIWCGENFPRWCGDYHSNVNVQALYWGLMTNNRLDLMEPYLNHYHRTAGVARKMTREYYRMRGIRFPHMGSIGGQELSPPNMLGTDPCGTAWVVQLFWQYYQHTMDRVFLRDIAYPLIRDAALFYSDFLTNDPRTGKWTIAPVVHFEARTNSPDQRTASPKPFEMWGTNSLYSQAMFRMAFQQAIQAAQALGVDEEHQREWRGKLDNLAPPPLAEGGYWKAWENHPPAYGYHNFLLPMVFPAELVSRFHGPSGWLEQARKTWEHLKQSSQECNTGYAWCGGEGVCELLRIGAVEEAFHRARWPELEYTGRRRVQRGMLVSFEEQQENGLSVNRSTPVLQVDHGPGMCRVLGDMLVLAPDGVIHLFAGIPDSMPARFLSLRAPGGFLITGEKRGREPDYILIQPTASRDLKLSNPWRGPVIVTDLSTRQSVHTTDQPVIETKLQIGREYLIARSGFVPDQLDMADFAFPAAS